MGKSFKELFEQYYNLEFDSDQYWLNYPNTDQNLQKPDYEFIHSIKYKAIDTLMQEKVSKEALILYLKNGLREATKNKDFVFLKFLISLWESLEIASIETIHEELEYLISLFTTEYDVVKPHIYLLERVTDILGDFQEAGILPIIEKLLYIGIGENDRDMINAIIKALFALSELNSRESEKLIEKFRKFKIPAIQDEINYIQEN
jgi:hypothetical protein